MAQTSGEGCGSISTLVSVFCSHLPMSKRRSSKVEQLSPVQHRRVNVKIQQAKLGYARRLQKPLDDMQGLFCFLMMLPERGDPLFLSLAVRTYTTTIRTVVSGSTTSL